MIKVKATAEIGLIGGNVANRIIRRFHRNR